MGGVGSGRKKLGVPLQTKYARRLKNKKTCKKWRDENRAKHAENAKKWREKNPDKWKKLNDENRVRNKIKKGKKLVYNLRYEREHPERAKDYYYANRQRCINNNKEYRKRKNLANSI